MIDSHTHLYFPEYGDEIEGIINKATDYGVKYFILPNVDVGTIEQMKKLHATYPLLTYMAMGLHPTEVKEDWKKDLNIIEKELEKNLYIAVGEVGMDLYWDTTYINEQKEVFERQLRIAESKNLPVIVHSRSALAETLEVIGKVDPKVPLVFHSFTGGPEDVKTIRKVCDPYFGINGVVTYKNAPDLREALKEIKIDKILLETDSPFLTPTPHRGKRNDSSYLIHIRNKIADILGLLPEEVEKFTDKNTVSVFGI